MTRRETMIRINLLRYDKNWQFFGYQSSRKTSVCLLIKSHNKIDKNYVQILVYWQNFSFSQTNLDCDKLV